MNRRVNRGLTLKQKKILDFITSFSKKHGYSPSLEEIAAKFGLKAISTVHHHIEALRKKGYLKKEKNQPRGVLLMQETPETVEVPLLGTIAAGRPIEPIENPEPVVIPKSIIPKKGNYYALRVQGDSMIDDGVWDKDLIVIHHQLTADENDTIVAITKDGATLKRLKFKKGKPYLQPRNPKYPPVFPKEKLEIRGKLVGIIHKES